MKYWIQTFVASHGLGAWGPKHTPKALCRYCHRDKKWCSPSPWSAPPPFGMEINLTGATCRGLGVLSIRFRLLPRVLNGMSCCSSTSRLIARRSDDTNSSPHSSLYLLWLLFITWLLFDLWTLRNEKLKDSSERWPGIVSIPFNMETLCHRN